MVSGAANYVTIPSSSDVPFPIGVQIAVEQSGSGTTYITSGSTNVIIEAASLSIGVQYAVTGLIQKSLDRWLVSSIAATSGTAGSSGTSATAGSSGTSATAGSSGTSATAGSSGTSATAGSSGTSATAGSSGTSATAGSSGTSATAGSSGTSGTSGSSVAAASQANMEAVTDNTVMVTPLSQVWHPGMVKCWVQADTAGTRTANYGVSSLTDGGTGQVTVTFTTAFSSATAYTVNATIQAITGSYQVANVRNVMIKSASLAAGSVSLICIDDTATTHLVKDPQSWHVAAYGDFA
jgi:hypothetical protein